MSGGNVERIDRVVDARGSFCPGPMMELIRAMRESRVGDVLAVLSTDTGSKTDIKAWAAKARHEFLGVFPEEGYDRIVVRKAR
ncbi:MAG TPA: sulfurtransferase TusA family protein [Thermodesulfobacteriota bacterium]